MVMKIKIVDMIEFDKIDWVEKRHREEYNRIEDLKKSIADNSLIQSLLVFKRKDGRYTLVAGGRRHTALVSLKESGTVSSDGEETLYLKDIYPDERVPCIIVKEDATQVDLDLLELEENIQREDLLPIELVNARRKIHNLLTEKNKGEWSERDTARYVGLSNVQMSQDLRLAEMADAIPGLEKAKTKKEAQKMVDKVVRDVETEAIVTTIEEREKKGTVDQRKKKLIDRYIVGDWFKMKKNLDEGEFDLVEIDPPFGINLKDMKKTKDGQASNLDEYNEWDIHSYKDRIELVVSDAWNLLKKDGWLVFWFGPHPWWDMIWKVITSQGFKGAALPGIWVKNVGQTMQPNLYLGHATEYFFYARKGEAILNKPGRNNVFEYPTVPDPKPHPTTKPIPLMEDIYFTFVRPGSRIVIPFLGSGWGILAADNMKMNALGYDLGQEYKDRFSVKVFEGQVNYGRYS